MGIVCPACGYENRITATYCGNCKKQISFECPRCREIYPIGAKYCSYCAYPVQVAPASEKCPACYKVIPQGINRCDYCNTSLIEPPRLQVSPERLDFGRVYVEIVEGEGYSETRGNYRTVHYHTRRPGKRKLLSYEFGEYVQPLELCIANTGGRRLDIGIHMPGDWVSIESQGVAYPLRGGESRRCKIKLNAYRLYHARRGRYSDNIIIRSNGGNATIPVTVEVV